MNDSYYFNLHRACYGDVVVEFNKMLYVEGSFLWNSYSMVRCNLFLDVHGMINTVSNRIHLNTMDFFRKDEKRLA